MNTTDLLEFAGYIFGAWATGFGAGYLMTKTRDAINMAV